MGLFQVHFRQKGGVSEGFFPCDQMFPKSEELDRQKKQVLRVIFRVLRLSKAFYPKGAVLNGGGNPCVKCFLKVITKISYFLAVWRNEEKNWPI